MRRDMEQNHQNTQASVADQKTLSEHFGVWLDTRLELFKVQAIERFSRLSGQVVQFAFLLLFGMLSATFIAITLAFFLSDLMDSMAMGFGVVSLLYVVLFIALALRGKMVMRELVVDWLVSEMMNEPKKNTTNENQ